MERRVVSRMLRIPSSPVKLEDDLSPPACDIICPLWFLGDGGSLGPQAVPCASMGTKVLDCAAGSGTVEDLLQNTNAGIHRGLVYNQCTSV